MSTFSGSPAASADDARESSSGVVNLTANPLQISTTYPYNGIRIPNVTITTGQTASAAYLTVRFSSSTYDSPDFDIYCHATDDAGIFAPTGYNISGRPTTTNFVTWSAADVGGGVDVVSPDLSPILNEIIWRGGWASGNDVAFILAHRGGTESRILSFDNGSHYPVLDVTYAATTAGTSYANPRRRAYIRF